MTDVDVQRSSRFIDRGILDQEDLQIIIETDQSVEAIVVQGLFDGLDKVGMSALLAEDIALGQGLGSWRHGCRG